MVILKNITKTLDSISADYYPEGIGKKGFMKIRLSDKQIIEHENTSSISALHVKMKLREFADMDNLPTEDIVMWY